MHRRARRSEQGTESQSEVLVLWLARTCVYYVCVCVHAWHAPVCIICVYVFTHGTHLCVCVHAWHAPVCIVCVYVFCFYWREVVLLLVGGCAFICGRLCFYLREVVLLFAGGCAFICGRLCFYLREVVLLLAGDAVLVCRNVFKRMRSCNTSTSYTPS